MTEPRWMESYSKNLFCFQSEHISRQNVAYIVRLLSPSTSARRPFLFGDVRPHANSILWRPNLRLGSFCNSYHLYWTRALKTSESRRHSKPRVKSLQMYRIALGGLIYEWQFSQKTMSYSRSRSPIAPVLLWLVFSMQINTVQLPFPLLLTMPFFVFISNTWQWSPSPSSPIHHLPYIDIGIDVFHHWFFDSSRAFCSDSFFSFNDFFMPHISASLISRAPAFHVN